MTTGTEGATMNINDYPMDEGGLTIFDAGVRTSEELCADIIQLALDCGWPGYPDPENIGPSTEEVLERYHQGYEHLYDGPDGVTIQEALEWETEEATEFLNEQLESDDHYVGCDYGAFGIWPIDLEGM